jgi:transcriptional regulator GlxA family with amidase domain
MARAAVKRPQLATTAPVAVPTEVLFVVLPHTLLLDLAGPAEAFRLANQLLVRRGLPAAYRLRYVAPQVQAHTSVGLQLAGLEPLPAHITQPTLVVLLGQPSGTESPLQRPLPRAWADTRRWLTHVVAPLLQPPGAGTPHTRLMTVCAGALLAADAGLLGQHRCTTHHEMLADLQRLAPAATVLGNRVFVVDGVVASSAGVTAGIDLALHLVAQDCGPALAAAVAQVMVVYLRRGPDDPELSPLLVGRNHLHPAVHRVQDAVAERPQHPWPLQQLAAVACVTPRHLSRLFAQHVGSTPRAYVEGIRAAVVQRALDQGQAAAHARGSAGISSDRQWRRVRGRVRVRVRVGEQAQQVPPVA